MSIETARLRLRLHRLDDFDALAAMWEDPLVVRYISGKPSTREQSWARLMRYSGHWTLLGYGYWAVEERETGKFVGEVGFADYKRDMPSAFEGPEIGWMFASHAHGKGYATEAVRAAIEWAQESLSGAGTMWCMIVPENAASLRVAEKCGLRPAGESSYAGTPVMLYERPL